MNKVNDKILNLKRLSEVNTDKSIQNGSYAIYPGARCPLALVTNVLAGIKDACALIVGTAECTYYNKNISLTLDTMSKGNQTWSYSLSPDEVIFGCGEGVLEALKQIDRTGPKAIFLISACVPELIGEDFAGMAREAGTVVNAKIIYIQAAHFRCYSSIPVRVETFNSLYQLMEKQEIKKKTVNILGDGCHFLKKSEFVTIIEKHGVYVNSYIPYNLTVEQIRQAPAAALSIVTDLAALPLAERMAEKFGIPYVMFHHLLDPKEIKAAYAEAAGYLNIDLEDEIERLCRETKNQLELYLQHVSGKTFACGYLSIDPFICSAFLSSQGMNPVYVETEYYFDEIGRFRDHILKDGYDPYIARTFNVNTTGRILKEYQVDYFFGYTAWQNLPLHINRHVKCETAAFALGFEQPLFLVKEMFCNQ